MSPRPKIAAITNGVGSTQQTNDEEHDPMKSRNDEAIPMAIATTATAIKSHARLNWKRGSGNQRREDRVDDVSGSGIFHSIAGEFSQPKQSNHTIRPGGAPNNGLLRSADLRRWRWRGSGVAAICRARAMSSCAVSFGLSSAMPCCKRICSSRSTSGSTQLVGGRTHAFCHVAGLGLECCRAA